MGPPKLFVMLAVGSANASRVVHSDVNLCDGRIGPPVPERSVEDRADHLLDGSLALQIVIEAIGPLDEPRYEQTAIETCHAPLLDETRLVGKRHMVKHEVFGGVDLARDLLQAIGFYEKRHGSSAVVLRCAD